MNAENTRQKLAQEIGQIRAALKLTMAEAARKVGVSEATWSRWESGKHIPAPEQMDQIARLRAKVPNTNSGFLGLYSDIRDRERLAAAIEGVQAEYRIGVHTVQLLPDGDLWINGHILIKREGANRA